jgi:hypothetical protein
LKAAQAGKRMKKEKLLQIYEIYASGQRDKFHEIHKEPELKKQVESQFEV